MKSTYLSLTLLTLLAAGPLLSQEVMTAEDAIVLGLKNNYDIRIARNDAQIAASNRGLGNAELLPSITAGGGVEWSERDQTRNDGFGPSGVSRDETTSGQVALNWTLFDGFGMFADRSRFRELAALGEAQARRDIEATVVNILFAYFDLVQQEQLLQVAENTLDISRLRLEKEAVRRELGGASSTDYLNAQVAFNNDQAAVYTSELNRLTARNRLNILLAQDPATPLQVDREILIAPLSEIFEELLTLAEAQNSDLQIATRSREVARQSVRGARSSFLPSINLGASYGYRENSSRLQNAAAAGDGPNPLVNESISGTVGVTFSWNLFNGLRDRIDWQNARLEEKNSEMLVADARIRLNGLLREKLETFRIQISLVDLELQNVSAAQQNLTLQQDRYRIGASTSLEFRDAQVNLALAQTKLIVARYRARITRLDIEQLTGRIKISLTR